MIYSNRCDRLQVAVTAAGRATPVRRLIYLLINHITNYWGLSISFCNLIISANVLN